ncbi:2-amino-4-hydroxy-6-hydroxymethyldihydropteridine diphosphokinase [Lacibacterium aquatile]|uniref:2-amino-4-hydroxy-6-hydroxymethyldihydropteridine pyrophosphokinase n=1 Tax=Lacibacterium aquatile TaxID=1168082 RepID=A0ABW5DQ67_9PROT
MTASRKNPAEVKSKSPAIFIALGGNLPSHAGSADLTLRSALDDLHAAGVIIEACSRFYRSAPVPVSDQPDFINAVARVSTDLAPAELLALLHRIEATFERVRTVRNAARTLDLDLLAYGDFVANEPALPHPRLQDRAFVLLPLQEVGPDFRHPLKGLTVTEMIAALPPGQVCIPMTAGGSA